MELVNIILILLFILCVILSINTDLKYNYEINYINYAKVIFIFISAICVINLLYKGLL